MGLVGRLRAALSRGPGAGAGSSLKHFLASRPLLVNSVTFGGLYVGAELTQQFIQYRFKRRQNPEHVFQLDLASLARYAVLGCVIFPPIIHYWYRWIDRRFVGVSKRVVAQKVCLDQFVFGPPCLATFFVALGLMEGQADIGAELRRKFPPTFALEASIWIPCQALNFALLPPQYRVIFISILSFTWVNVLCVIKSLEAYTADEPAPA